MVIIGHMLARWTYKNLIIDRSNTLLIFLQNKLLSYQITELLKSPKNIGIKENPGKPNNYQDTQQKFKETQESHKVVQGIK